MRKIKNSCRILSCLYNIFLFWNNKKTIFPTIYMNSYSSVPPKKREKITRRTLILTAVAPTATHNPNSRWVGIPIFLYECRDDEKRKYFISLYFFCSLLFSFFFVFSFYFFVHSYNRSPVHSFRTYKSTFLCMIWE